MKRITMLTLICALLLSHRILHAADPLSKQAAAVEEMQSEVKASWKGGIRPVRLPYYKTDNKGQVVSLSWTERNRLELAIAQVKEDKLAVLKDLPSLESIELTGLVNVTDNGLVHLAKLHQLKRIVLDLNAISGRGLVHLGGLKNLKSLAVMRCKVNDGELSHLEHLVHLEELSFANTSISDVALRHIGKLTKLRKLDLGGTQVTDVGLKHLKDLIDIESLVLPYGVSDTGLASLKSMTRLKHISLGKPTATSSVNKATPKKQLTTSAVIRLFTELQGRTVGEAIYAIGIGTADSEGNIESLFLHQSDTQPRITNDVMQHCGRLTRLIIISPAITDAGFKRLQCQETLKELRLSNETITDQGMVHLATMTELRALSLQGNGIVDSGLAHIAGLRALQKLVLNYCPRITSEGVQHIDQLSKLTHLDLRYTKLDDAGAANLTKLRNLRTLHLGNTRLTGKGLAHVSQLTSLESLELTNTDITDADLIHLAKLSKLNVLQTAGTKVSANGRLRLFRDIQNRSAAEVLAIEGIIGYRKNSEVTRVDVGTIYLDLAAELTHLEELSARGPQVTADSLSPFSSHNTLKELSLYNCENVDNAALEQIGKIRSLESLELHRCHGVTDEGLHKLANLTHLDSFAFSGSRVTPKGIERLQRQLPKCQISYRHRPKTK